MNVVSHRFKIHWIVDKALQTYANIDKDLHLSDKEKKYLKALHDHSKKGQLSKRPTLNDYKVLAKAYGKYMIITVLPTNLYKELYTVNTDSVCMH